MRTLLALVRRVRRWVRRDSAAATSRAALEARRRAETDSSLYL